jgi:hypothetical protein
MGKLITKAKIKVKKLKNKVIEKNKKKPYLVTLKTSFKEIFVNNNQKAWKELISYVKTGSSKFKKEFIKQYKDACKAWPEFKDQFKIK